MAKKSKKAAKKARRKSRRLLARARRKRQTRMQRRMTESSFMGPAGANLRQQRQAQFVAQRIRADPFFTPLSATYAPNVHNSMAFQREERAERKVQAAQVLIDLSKDKGETVAPGDKASRAPQPPEDPDGRIKTEREDVPSGPAPDQGVPPEPEAAGDRIVPRVDWSTQAANEMTLLSDMARPEQPGNVLTRNARRLKAKFRGSSRAEEAVTPRRDEMSTFLMANTATGRTPPTPEQAHVETKQRLALLAQYRLGHHDARQEQYRDRIADQAQAVDAKKTRARRRRESVAYADRRDSGWQGQEQ